MIYWEKHRFITSLYAQCAKPVCDEFNITMMQYNILMFIHNNPACDTAAEIVKMRALTKSHVSTALKDLEARDYIRRYFKPGNSKTIHITITEKCAPLIEMGNQAQRDFYEKLFKDFSPEELNMCRTLYTRMCENSESFIK